MRGLFDEFTEQNMKDACIASGAELIEFKDKGYKKDAVVVNQHGQYFRVEKHGGAYHINKPGCGGGFASSFEVRGSDLVETLTKIAQFAGV